MRIVKVRWIDAFSSEGTWWSEDMVPERVPEEAWVTSVGFEVRSNDDGLWLTMGTGADGKIFAPFFIPRTMLQEVNTIEL